MTARTYLSTVWDWWTSPYRLLKEPRLVSACLAAAYLTIAGTIGLPTLAATPHTLLAAHVSLGLAWTVGTLTVIGGALAASSLLGGAWIVERGGIWFLWAGLAARACLVWGMPWDTTTIVRLGELLALCLLLAARYARVSGLDLDPGRGLGDDD